MADEKIEKSEKNENKGSIGFAYFANNLANVLGWPEYRSPAIRTDFPEHGKIKAYPTCIFNSYKDVEPLVKKEEEKIKKDEDKKLADLEEFRKKREEAEKEKKAKLEAYGRAA
jgi:hypothetical protein